jgi:hypothetical protein
MPAAAYNTAHDLQDRLLDFMGGASEGRNVKIVNRAMLDSLRDLANVRNWACYYRRERIVTSASYSTGTVDFDLTGGTYELMLTLASGTWPTDAAKGIVKIDDVEYRVDERKSSTVLTLQSGFAPSADIAALTEYVWYRDNYSLPADFRRADQIIDLSWTCTLDRVLIGDILRHRSERSAPGRPDRYAISTDERLPNRLAFYFDPPPDDDYNLDYMIQRTPYPLRTIDYSTGTVTIVGGTTSVAGTGTAWTTDMEGSVIRVTSGTEIPSGVEGLNPFAEERIIDQVTSATALTVTTAFTNSYTTKKYRISDRIDLEDGAMFSAFVACCKKNIAWETRRDDAPTMSSYYNQCLRLAMEADNRGYEPRTRPASWRSVKDLPIGDDVGA